MSTVEVIWLDEGSEDEGVAEGDEPPPLNEVVSARATRRRIKRRKIRGVRPVDPIEAKTTSWYRSSQREAPSHPRYRRTRLVLAPDENGHLVTDVARACPKPSRDERLDLITRSDDRAINQELATDEEPMLAAATTDEKVEVGSFVDIVLEKSRIDHSTIVRVFVSYAEEHDPDEATFGGIAEEFIIELPFGFHVEDGGGALSRHHQLERLQQAAQIDPDWGDPDLWDMGRYEPTYLIVR